MGRGCTSAGAALNGEGVHKCGRRTEWGGGAQVRVPHWMGRGCTSAGAALNGEGVLKCGGRTEWGGIRIRIRIRNPVVDPDPAMDPDPAIFVINLYDANKNLFFSKCFWLLLFEGKFTYFSKIKSQKLSKSSKNQVFFLLFLLGDRRIRIGSRAGSGSIPLTNGSGSRRPKNKWIRIRIRNPAYINKNSFETLFRFEIIIKKLETRPIFWMKAGIFLKNNTKCT